MTAYQSIESFDGNLSNADSDRHYFDAIRKQTFTESLSEIFSEDQGSSVQEHLPDLEIVDPSSRGIENQTSFSGMVGVELLGSNNLGFEQHLPQEEDDCDSLLEHIKEGVSEFFGLDRPQTLREGISERIMSSLTAEEREQFEQEEDAMKHYRSVSRQHRLRNPEDFPDMPDMTMHREVQRRVQEAMSTIGEAARSELSPAEQAELDEWIEEPYQPGEPFRMMATGGRTIELDTFSMKPKSPAVEDYYENVQALTQQYLETGRLPEEGGIEI